MSNENRDDLKIALVLRSVRAAMGLNLKEMAAILDVAASTVGKFESNDLSLRAASYMKLEECLRLNGIKIEYQREGTNDDDDEVVIRFKKAFVDDLVGMSSKAERRDRTFQKIGIVFNDGSKI